ncbi:MAG: HlyD family efflux transporter periplasmic adaptor subunit [Calditrichaeota bacterium]|nr:MAG: HlyD family efflux transporter periplasmic adaptor subunit [Calditrichota bacterium]MBL1204111.1 HlyD family efflux transporter periplasmic adaptor subunit [Calditrichota bacterium]NOG43942.1 HlyD family efflux transporter periplasmic adaptor subunit [Calditrichota bacterium]
MKNLKSILIGAALIISALVISGFLGSQNKEDIKKPEIQETVSKETIKVKNEIHEKTINTTGRMYAFEKVDLYSEVSGVLETNSIKFKEGKKYSKGETLLSINSDVYENTLKSQKSSFLNQLTLLLPDLKFDFPDEYAKWDKYLREFKIEAPIENLPKAESERENFYLASNNIFKLYYDIKSMEATFDKYTIEAPFAGIVTEANINPGTLVMNGQKLGEFINTSLFEMEAAISLSEINLLKIGTMVELKSIGSEETIEGKLVRINEKIDSETQSVKVFIQSSDKKIKDGMFLSAELKTNSNTSLAKLPEDAISNNIVKVQVENVEKEIEVEIYDRSEDYVYVKGLEDDSLVVIEPTIN